MDCLTKSELLEIIDYMTCNNMESGFITFNGGERLIILDSKQANNSAWVTIHDLKELVKIF